MADVQKLAAEAVQLLMEKRANSENYSAEGFKGGLASGAAVGLGSSLYKRLPYLTTAKRAALTSLLWGSVGGLSGSMINKQKPSV